MATYESFPEVQRHYVLFEITLRNTLYKGLQKIGKFKNLNYCFKSITKVCQKITLDNFLVTLYYILTKISNLKFFGHFLIVLYKSFSRNKIKKKLSQKLQIYLGHVFNNHV